MDVFRPHHLAPCLPPKPVPILHSGVLISSLRNKRGASCLESWANLQNPGGRDVPPAIHLPSNSSAIGTSSTIFDSTMDASAFHLDLECTTGIENRQAVDSSFRHLVGDFQGKKCCISTAARHFWTAPTKSDRTIA